MHHTKKPIFAYICQILGLNSRAPNWVKSRSFLPSIKNIVLECLKILKEAAFQKYKLGTFYLMWMWKNRVIPVVLRAYSWLHARDHSCLGLGRPCEVPELNPAQLNIKQVLYLLNYCSSPRNFLLICQTITIWHHHKCLS